MPAAFAISAGSAAAATNGGTDDDRICRICDLISGVIENDLSKGRMTREMNEVIVEENRLGQMGASEDVVKACHFLASDLSAYVTGTVTSVNGGLLIF